MSPQSLQDFDCPPTQEALADRLARVDVAAYEHSRNHLHGAVTRLSPYLTHGFISLPEGVARLRARTRLSPQDKLYAELCWREFYQHVWSHLGSGIFSDLRPPLPGIEYACEVPEDIRRGATGLAVIDQAVRTLYRTGYLHNHARMWLASYLIHGRKIAWRAGADWMYAHLLDGDLASNHLSWQWVAGTFSTRPYLFNAENVARFAPPDWQVKGSVLDVSYADLESLARSPHRLPAGTGEGLQEPPTCVPDAQWASLPACDEMEWVHPWMLHPRPSKAFRLGVIHLAFHARFPWSAGRWHFVLEAMRRETDAIFVGDLDQLGPLLSGKRVSSQLTLNPGYREALLKYSTLPPTLPQTLLKPPDRLCASFSQFWRQTHPTIPLGGHRPRKQAPAEGKI